MGGTIAVESEPGVGSIFHVTLEVEEAAVPPNHGMDSETLRGRRVLIVDDNATNREVVRRHTAAWGMTSRDTGSPQEALDWITRGDPFDLAVLDRQMPDMDGLELAGKLRDVRPAALPVVILTSLGTRDRQREAEVGVELASHLAKPIKASQLHDALVEALTGDAKSSSEDAPREPAGGRSGPLRILLAEDNAVNRQVAQLTLAKLGYEADAVENGLEALKALRNSSYDLVLMDIEMPEMDGLEASRRIHAEWNAEERPRIVAMTANAMPGDREMCLAAGMDDYLSKPIRSEDLTAALDRSPAALAPEASVEGGGELVDQEALERLQEATGDETFVHQLVATFLEEAPKLLEALSEAIESGDAELLRRSAHTLKSNARTFGAERLATRCQELETLARSGAIGEAAGRLERGIEHDLAEVSTALRRTVGA